jgi:hypothetical protein
LLFFADPLPAAIYHIVPQNASQIGKTPLCGITGGGSFMPPRQAALRRQALVMAVAFPHHAVQEKTVKTPHPMPSAKSAGRAVSQSKNEERCGGE